MSSPLSRRLPFTGQRLHRQDRGFTLIEVMIVVGIVAILAAIAVPAYTKYLRQGDLTEAMTTLTDYRIRMEQYYQDNRAYGSSGTTCAGGKVPPSAANDLPKNFTMTCATANSASTYTLTATGNGTRTTGYTYSIDETGTKKTTQWAGSTSTKTCWLIKGNEC